MFPKSLTRIDRFYLLLTGVLLVLLLLVFFTFKGVFSAVKTAAEIDEQMTAPKIGIDTEKLNKASKAVF